MSSTDYLPKLLVRADAAVSDMKAFLDELPERKEDWWVKDGALQNMINALDDVRTKPSDWTCRKLETRLATWKSHKNFCFHMETRYRATGLIAELEYAKSFGPAACSVEREKILKNLQDKNDPPSSVWRDHGRFPAHMRDALLAAESFVDKERAEGKVLSIRSSNLSSEFDPYEIACLHASTLISFLGDAELEDFHPKINKKRADLRDQRTRSIKKLRSRVAAIREPNEGSGRTGMVKAELDNAIIEACHLHEELKGHASEIAAYNGLLARIDALRTREKADYDSLSEETRKAYAPFRESEVEGLQGRRCNVERAGPGSKEIQRVDSLIEKWSKFTDEIKECESLSAALDSLDRDCSNLRYAPRDRLSTEDRISFDDQHLTAEWMLRAAKTDRDSCWLGGRIRRWHQVERIVKGKVESMRALLAHRPQNGQSSQAVASTPTRRVAVLESGNSDSLNESTQGSVLDLQLNLSVHAGAGASENSAGEREEVYTLTSKDSGLSSGTLVLRWRSKAATDGSR